VCPHYIGILHALVREPILGQRHQQCSRDGCLYECRRRVKKRRPSRSRVIPACPATRSRSGVS